MGNSNSRFSSSTTAEEAADNVDLAGKWAIVTGSNSGIGTETTRVLLKQGATVCMACRNTKSGEEARKSIIESLISDDDDDSKVDKSDIESRIFLLKLDLDSLASVRSFAEEYRSKFSALHYLVNNAGIMALPDYKETVDGYEKQFGVNHLGHAYLTMLLTPILLHSQPSRVILVSSSEHKSAPKPFSELIDKYVSTNNGPQKESYSAWRNYGISKALNLLFAREYNYRFSAKGITAVSLHPGVIHTNLFQNTNYPTAVSVGMTIASPFLKSIAQGAATTIRCVSLPDDEIIGGHYYSDCNDSETKVNRNLQSSKIVDSDEKEATDKSESMESKIWSLTEALITKKGFSLTLDNESYPKSVKEVVSSNAAAIIEETKESVEEMPATVETTQNEVKSESTSVVTTEE